MTDEEFEAIESRVDSTSPGQWRATLFEASCHEDGQDDMEIHGPRSKNGPVVMSERDARFVVQAHSDVCALSAEVRRLRRLPPKPPDQEGRCAVGVQCACGWSVTCVAESVAESLLSVRLRAEHAWGHHAEEFEHRTECCPWYGLTGDAES